MNKSLRIIVAGLSLAAFTGLSLAADAPAGAGPSSAPAAAAPATNVQTPATKPAKKKVKHKKSGQAHSTAKKQGS